MDQTTPLGTQASAAASHPLAEPKWAAHLLALLLGAIAITAAFFPTAKEMIRVWEISVAFQHCWLIPVIIAYLVWERRQDLKKLQPRAYLPGALVVAAAGFLWLLGWAANVNFVQQFGYVGMLQGLVLATLGPTVTRGIMFPVCFAVFAVPFGEEFVPFLQKITVFFTVGLLKLSGLPFINDGVFISVLTGKSGETHNFQIAQECSGIRYITAMAATASLFANIGFKSWARRFGLLFMAFAVAILANSVRAFGIIYIAHTSDMKYAVGVDHIIYGWVFFAFVMALVILIGYTFMDKPLDAPAVDIAPLVARDATVKSKSPFWLGSLTASIASALIALYASSSNSGAQSRQVTLTLPNVPGWSATNIPDSKWDPVYEGASGVARQSYIDSKGEIVTLYVAYYDMQSEGREMVRYGNGTTGGDLNWTWAENLPGVTLKDSPPPHAYQLNGNGLMRDVYQWYWVNGKIASSDGAAKLHGALARLFRGDGRSATIIISSERTGVAPTTDALTKFGNDLGSVDAFAHAMVDKI